MRVCKAKLNSGEFKAPSCLFSVCFCDLVFNSQVQPCAFQTVKPKVERVVYGAKAQGWMDPANGLQWWEYLSLS